jgi:hypothetical protein
MKLFTKTVPPSGRVDWKAERDKIDLAAVATNLLGPAPGRRGERSSRKLWWSCPFHPDANPSLMVEVGKPFWRCFGCGEHGDAANLLMRLRGLSFPEAVAALTGARGPVPTRPGKAPSRPATGPAPKPPPGPSGLPEADALSLVDEAQRLQWSPEGTEGLAYLRGRGLNDETIRAARLGWTSWVTLPKADGGTFRALGVVIPWYHKGRLALVKIRQPEGRSPKYVEAFRDPARLVCYPGPETIRPGRPSIIVEGELDALLLAQELAPLDVSVLTLGSAGARPEPALIGALLPCPAWFLATDRDEAGDRAADAWPGRARRLRPPELIGQPCKDWTDCHQSGVPLLRLWENILTPPSPPPPWEALAAQTWGDPAEGDEPDPARAVASEGPSFAKKATNELDPGY